MQVLTAHGAEGGYWDDILHDLPWALRDPHFTSAWGRLHEALDAQPLLAVLYEVGLPAVIQPFLWRSIPGGGWTDLTAAGYGGPLPIQRLPSPELREEFDQRFSEWCEGGGRKVVSEFYLTTPLLAARQGMLVPGYTRRERAVTVLDTDGEGLELRPNRRQSLAKAERATVQEIDSGTFWQLYAASMDRKDAAPRWRKAPGHFGALKELGAQFLGAFDGKLLVAGAVFLMSGNAAYYLYAATAEDPPSGYADRLVLAGWTMAKKAGASWLHLGGGLDDGDSLAAYKRSFGGLQRPVYSVQTVRDRGTYQDLTLRALGPARDMTAFFPAYRAAEAST